MSSTKYLDEIIMDERGEIIRDIMENIKGYCGLFGFIAGICNTPSISKEKKASIITGIIESSLKFMRKKYETNLKMYEVYATENLEEGNKFEQLSVTPAKMREDFEAGIDSARKYLYIETRDILKILDMDLEI
jgi:hypothetical protein